MLRYTRTPAAQSLNPTDASSLPSISINSDGPRTLSDYLADGARYTSWSAHVRTEAPKHSSSMALDLSGFHRLEITVSGASRHTKKYK